MDRAWQEEAYGLAHVLQSVPDHVAPFTFLLFARELPWRSSADGSGSHGGGTNIWLGLEHCPNSLTTFAKEVFISLEITVCEIKGFQGGYLFEPNADGRALMDIFGFENMPINGFEQMFINLANEAIQKITMRS